MLGLAAPSAAQAAEVSVSDGVLRYTAAAGRINDVTFDETAPGHRARHARHGRRPTDVIQTATGCTREHARRTTSPARA